MERERGGPARSCCSEEQEQSHGVRCGTSGVGVMATLWFALGAGCLKKVGGVRKLGKLRSWGRCISGNKKRLGKFTLAISRVREIARGASKSARLEAPPGPALDGSEQSGSGTQPHDQI